MSNPIDFMKSGDLKKALTSLQDNIRKEPAKSQYRVFLFQLLSVLGDWKRALTQLNVAGELDALAIPMVKTYQEALQCEVLRQEVFAGKRSPLIFGEPEPWLAMLIEALHLEASDATDRAAELRAQAFELAPVTSGRVGEAKFEWMADADPRLRPVLEAVIKGHYYWVPFHHIQSIAIEAPTDLRDFVWLPATFVWSNQGEMMGLIPVRYNETVQQQDPQLLLAHRTEWIGERPVGQRMLTTDAAEYSLLDLRTIHFDTGHTRDAR